MELVEPIRNEIKQDEMDGQRERSQSPLWNVLGREFPSGEIVFFWSTVYHHNCGYCSGI